MASAIRPISRWSGRSFLGGVAASEILDARKPPGRRTIPARFLAYRGPFGVPGAALTSSDGSGPMTGSHAHQRGSSAILRTWADPDVALRPVSRMAPARRPTRLTPRRDVGKAATPHSVSCDGQHGQCGPRQDSRGRRGEVLAARATRDRPTRAAGGTEVLGIGRRRVGVGNAAIGVGRGLRGAGVRGRAGCRPWSHPANASERARGAGVPHLLCRGDPCATAHPNPRGAAQ